MKDDGGGGVVHFWQIGGYTANKVVMETRVAKSRKARDEHSTTITIGGNKK